MSTIESNRPVKMVRHGTQGGPQNPGSTHESINTRIFGKNLIETRDGSEEDDGIHVIEKRDPGSCQKSYPSKTERRTAPEPPGLTSLQG